MANSSPTPQDLIGRVTAREVRTALDAIPDDRLGTETIEQAIEEAEVTVARAADPAATDRELRLALRWVAAREAYFSSPAVKRERELDASQSYATTEFASELRRKAELYLGYVENPDAGVDPTVNFNVY